MKYGATIDETGKYRYSLWRIWDASLPKVLFIMLNPSTADAFTDDPTIKRCIRFAQDWGFGSLEVVNLFAWRATIPLELKSCADPFGTEIARYIREAALRADKIVCAWGTMGDLYSSSKSVCEMLEPLKLYCLDITQNGQPKHPLYIAANKELIRYPAEAKP